MSHKPHPATVRRPVLLVSVLVPLLATLVAAPGAPGPGPLDPTRLATWAAGRPAASITFAVLRLVAVTMTGYLVLALLAGLATRAVQPDLARTTDRLTVAPLRRVLGGAARITFGAVALAPMPVGAAGAAPGDDAITTLTLSTPADAEPQSATEPTRTQPDAPPPEHPARSGTSSEAIGKEPARWLVTSGDHLWSIAEAVLTEGLGGPLSDDQIAEYWTRVVSLNRDRLADPDLILAGQSIELPPLEG